MSYTATRRTLRVVFWLGFSAVGMTCLSAGCSKSEETAESGAQPQFEVADEDAGPAPTGSIAPDGATGTAGMIPGVNGGESSPPPSLSMNQLDPITVPDGTPAELLAFSQQVGEKIRAVQGKAGELGQAAVEARLIELFRSLLSAADKILAASDAKREERLEAVQNKAGAMGFLSQLEPQSDWAAKVLAFATSLANDADPAIAIEGKAIVFGMSVGEFAKGRDSDVQGLLNRLNALLQEEGRSVGVMRISLEAMNTLVRLGYQKEGRQALDQIVAAFQDSQDPTLAAETARLVEQARFLDAEIEPKFSAVLAKRVGAEGIFVDELAKILAQSAPGILTLDKGARYIGTLQQTGQYELARKLCQMFQDKYAESSNEELKELADRVTEMALRRINLVGKPLVVDARRLDGVSLDFSQYQGKIVLVVFFAAFDVGSRQEMINIKKNAYDKYHDQGFEVIGVSVDPNPQVLEKFLELAQLPWTTVTNNQFAEQCGADMLPFTVLLDRSGKVIDIFVQGNALPQTLETLFGAAGAAQPAAP